MSEDVMFKQAIDAIAKGQNSRGRDLLTRLLRADQANPTYWLWMSAVVETRKERLYCLQTALRLDPDKQAARRGLVMLGQLPPPEDVSPKAPIRRDWQAASESVSEKKSANTLLDHVRSRRNKLMVIGVAIIILIPVVVFGSRWREQRLVTGMHLTITPITWTPAPTSTFPPTNTPYARTPTPTFIGPAPLWMSLEATYTPTPLYVDTPHPITEAYRAGMRAFHAGNISAMVQYMKQAAELESSAADIHYYLGEAYRLLGELENALAAYESAIAADATFAPAYLGRARIKLARNPAENVALDLELAVLHDPEMGEAYLDRAQVLLREKEIESAFEDLRQAEKLLPESPWLYLIYAQAYLLSGDASLALENARLAHELDITLLPAYLALGQAHLANQNPAQASQVLETYLLYEDGDVAGWFNLGVAHYESKADYESALHAFTRVIELEENSYEAYIYRGLVHLELGNGNQAVNDFFQARQLDQGSFSAGLGLARALQMAGRVEDSMRQFNAVERLAQDEFELASYYFWRAQARDAAGDANGAIRDWEALLELPEESYPEEWGDLARERLAILAPTSTPTPHVITPTLTITPNSTN